MKKAIKFANNLFNKQLRRFVSINRYSLAEFKGEYENDLNDYMKEFPESGEEIYLRRLKKQYKYLKSDVAAVAKFKAQGDVSTWEGQFQRDSREELKRDCTGVDGDPLLTDREFCVLYDAFLPGAKARFLIKKEMIFEDVFTQIIKTIDRKLEAFKIVASNTRTETPEEKPGGNVKALSGTSGNNDNIDDILFSDGYSHSPYLKSYSEKEIEAAFNAIKDTGAGFIRGELSVFKAMIADDTQVPGTLTWIKKYRGKPNRHALGALFEHIRNKEEKVSRSDVQSKVINRWIKDDKKGETIDARWKNGGNEKPFLLPENYFPVSD